MSLDDELTTENETRKEQAAAAAADRIKKGQHWLDWMYIAEGLEIGRAKALRKIGSPNDLSHIQHPAYRKAFREWMEKHKWASDLDKPTRTHLFWCLDHRNDIEAWRETLAQNERAKLNHPTTMKRKYEATHAERSSPQGEKPLSPSAKKDAEIARLQEELDDRTRENVKLKRSVDEGSEVDWGKDNVKNIARVLFEVHRDKARAVASEILRLSQSNTHTPKAKAKAA